MRGIELKKRNNFWKSLKACDNIESYERVLDVAKTYTDYVSVNLWQESQSYNFLAHFICNLLGL